MMYLFMLFVCSCVIVAIVIRYELKLADIEEELGDMEFLLEFVNAQNKVLLEKGEGLQNEPSSHTSSDD